MLKMYRSVVEVAINVVMSPNEAYGVVAIASYVLIKALQIYEEEVDFGSNIAENSHLAEDVV